MKGNIRKSYNFQFAVTIIVTIIAFIFLFFYTYKSFYHIAKTDSLTIGDKAVYEVSEKVSNLLLEGTNIVNNVTESIEYMLKYDNSPKAIANYLNYESKKCMSRRSSDFLCIYGYIDGKFIDSWNWLPPENFSPTERSWYKKAVNAAGKSVLVEPYIDLHTNKLILSISKMLSDGESVISLDVSLTAIQDLTKNVNLNGEGYGFIVDKTGLVIAHFNEYENGTNLYNKSDEDIVKLVKNIYKNNGGVINMNIDGGDCTIFSKNLMDIGFIVIVMSSDSISQRLHVSLIGNILITVFILFVIIYFCTTTFLAKNQSLEYARQLKDIKDSLEIRVLQQTAKIRAQTKEFVHIQENVIEGIATMVEYRDESTGEHVRNTKKYAMMIASFLWENEQFPDEIDEEFVAMMGNAAALHDIGKIKISDTILNKEGPLTEEEKLIMKNHTIIGGNLAKKILGNNVSPKMVQMASDVARYHHERWDGKGYPDGLKGNEIPICARIMAVADVFDALISKRVYKEAVSVEEAFVMIKNESGSHFDPAIIDVFMQLHEELIIETSKNS